MMQAPHRVTVSMQLKIITDYLPENAGQFYTLAKNNDKYGSVQGIDNWLSDSTSVYTANASRLNALPEDLKFIPPTDAELEAEIFAPPTE